MTRIFGSLPSLAIIAIMGDILGPFFSASAQSSQTTSTRRATSTGKVHVVEVGNVNGGFMYSPNTTTAEVGDIVMFEFFPTNHSVVRGEYTESKSCGSGGCNPCVPYELIHPKESGFNSKNIITQTIPSSSNPGDITFNLTINDTSPIWFYCTALTSCNPNGMVGAINPSEGQSIGKQHDAAVGAKFQLSPGEAWPAEGGSPGAETATAIPTAGAGNNNSGGHHLSGGAIAGIVIGAVAVAFLGAALFYFVGRSKTYRDILKNPSEGAGGAASSAGDGPAHVPWTPQMQSSSVGTSQWDPRMSQQTAYSQVPTHPADGTFVGYNRQTGAPEFAAEAPMSEKKSDQPGGHPAFRNSNQETTYELPGETPAAAEIGPHK